MIKGDSMEVNMNSLLGDIPIRYKKQKVEE
jgi:hypothetical protein